MTKVLRFTERQRKFADEYLLSGNIERSAINAGYSKNYARSRSHELLSNVGVKAYLEERNKQIDSDKIADMKEVKQFWTEMLRNNGVEPKDRLKASDFIAKTNGAYLERIEHSGGVQVENALTGMSTEELRKMVEKMK